MAVKLGYQNVYRDPYGYPEWQQRGMPIESASGSRDVCQMSGPTIGSETPGPLRGWAMLWTLLGIFAGGLALNLTPCVYPMIPITVSFFGGRAAREKPSQMSLFAHGVSYLLGLALTNSTLGVLAALTGGLMGAILQNPAVVITVAAILLCFAASLFGFWELRLPSALTRAAAKSYGGYFGSLFMGLTMGVVAAPCIGPFVLGLLTWVAGMGSPWLGFLVFFTLSLGLGLPLFLLAIFSGQLQRLPRAGGWMMWVRNLMGWFLVGMAAYFIRTMLPESLKVVLSAGVVLAAGLHLGWLDKNQANFQAFPWLKTLVGIGCISVATFWVTGWVMRGPGVSWQSYSNEVVEQALQKKKPAIIDFYADWCTPCRELEKVTFHHAEVIKQAREHFVMIKVDLTRGGTPLYDDLLKQYGVKGVPTVIFVDARGKERTDLRLVDFIPPESFLGRMSELRRENH